MSFINVAYAEAAGEAAQQGGGMASLLFLLVFFAIFYLLFIRPQSKRAKQHRQMVENLQVGDEVITNGGILGRITSVDDGFVSVEIAKGTEIKIQKPAVAASMPKGTIESSS